MEDSYIEKVLLFLILFIIGLYLLTTDDPPTSKP